MALTKDQILQAADQLAAAGETPTLAAVRKSVGGGSYTTINEALKEWKAKQHSTNTPIREPAPAAVATRLEELGADIWAVALELANTRLTSEREALEATRVQLETAQQEATELADQLNVELEALQANYKEAMSDLQEARAHLNQANLEKVTLTRQLATTEARAEETTKRADDLRAELQHAHAENTAQRQRHADEIQRLNERLTQAQTEREQAQQAASSTREDAAGLRGELEALRVQNAALLETLKPKQLT
ncbi:DNA-binding protein (plasmid) [Thiothrix lacustris]|uniref:DNA-binding protein n=1 Tax=Thiothrix lacustris TaxID=525917 RepID=A0ABY9MV22_9GAMM|nr:DNA-binding protein [Thiothrix lacustris]WML92517.1 DNA-binding protein [Thiothrix lacustris]